MADLRGFGRDNVDAMNDAIIDRVNSRVHADDVMFFLGDFAFTSIPAAEALFDRINCQTIRMVTGNHDSSKMRRRLGWTDVEHYREFRPNGGTGTYVCMSHYPMVVWNRSHYGSIMLHGHSHGNGDNGSLRRFDVGLDSPEIDEATGKLALDDDNMFGPFSIDEIVLAAEARVGLPDYDHHDRETNP